MAHLKREEKQLLWGKYMKSGISEEEANFRLNNVIAHLDSQVRKWKKKNLSAEQINEKFKQEFWLLCRKLEN